MKTIFKYKGKIASFFIVVAVLLLAISIWPRKVDIPLSIKKQLNFTALYPSDDEIFKVDKESFKYDASGQVLSYNVNWQTLNIVVSEQPYPETQDFDKLASTLNQYTQLQTQLGKVGLGRPRNLNGKQVAIFSNYNGSAGVLMFATPDKDLTNQQWTQFFNNFRPVS